MQINQDYNTAAYTIRAYEDGKVTLATPLTVAENTLGRDGDSAFERMGAMRLESSFIVMPDVLIQDWQASDFNSLRSQHFDMLLEYQPELVLLGTGDQLRFPKAEITANLAKHRIGVEVMNVAAACRTYNFLMADGRRVAAALLLEN